MLRRRRAGERVVATGFPAERHFDLDAIDREGIHKGMVTVIEGCNKRCTFCIVPTTRGPERCRPIAEVLRRGRAPGAARLRRDRAARPDRQPLARAQRASRASERSGTGRGDLDFADLLEAVATLPGVRRLRFVTSYPRDFTPRMVEQVGRHENICPYLHLPVQSGSDRILRRMGRGYAIDSYLRLADDLRAARPGLALSTDLIVGFPGETEDDFGATLALVERVRFAQVFAFKYSPRPAPRRRASRCRRSRTTSPRAPQELFALQKGIQKEINDELVGRTMEVLVTGWGRAEGQQTGRTACHRIVLFSAGAQPARAGELVTRAHRRCAARTACSAASSTTLRRPHRGPARQAAARPHQPLKGAARCERRMVR